MKYEENEKIREQIDAYLEEMTKIESNLGTDSTSSEVKKATQKKHKLMLKIKELDEEFYKKIEP